jgi:hypothetical protein
MPASVRLAAASAVAASLFVTAISARSADLYTPRYGSAYDDSRYGESFGDGSPAEEHYAEPDDELGAPYRHAYKGDFKYGYKNGYKDDFKDDAFDRRYDPPRYAARGDGCVPRHIAHARLRADGWRDFGDFEARGNIVLMQARRSSGRLFDLTIDTCSGEIVEARPLHTGRSYAGASRRQWQPY